MVHMMHSGLFVGMMLAALLLLFASMYAVIRVVGGRTQAREQAVARSRLRKSPRLTATKPPH